MSRVQSNFDEASALPSRDEWLDLARDLDWTWSYVSEVEAFPEELSGRPWLPGSSWSDFDEPYRTSFGEYVTMQAAKEVEVRAVAQAIGNAERVLGQDAAWVNAIKLHAAVLPLAEFAAVVGNLRAARFGRHAAWRTMSTFGALDECRHTQIPLRLMHSLVARDQQFDWTHRFYHSNCWVAIAARHLFDELLLTTDPVEFAVGTHFVFETGLTNLQFIGLAAVADQVRDELFASMLTSIQTDEARHAQIGAEVLRKLCQHDRAYAQQLADKWFWRSWLLFAVVTGFTMDYLTPLEKRKSSFKEFVEEWIVGQYLDTLHDLGLERPYYWDTFRQSLDYYHHMVYASAYTYRATVWFDLVVPGPAERAWLREKYPNSWSDFEPVWEQVAASWKASGPGLDLCMYSTAIVGFCNLCQVVLCGGTPTHNTAQVVETTRGNRVFCSEPCRRIYEREPDKYAQHRGLVDRVLAGQAPANLVELLTAYCGLPEGEWGKDAYRGRYEWLFGGERRC